MPIEIASPLAPAPAPLSAPAPVSASEPPPAERSAALLFLREWLAAPLRVAAVAPSGRRLAAVITSELDADRAPVIELGPGTGVFTRALIARGIPEERLALVEASAGFAARLSEAFPRAAVYRMDAARLRTVMPFGPGAAGAVVSGLPLPSLSPRTVYGVLSGALRNLRPGGAVYQFTYGWRCPVPPSILDRLGLRAEAIGHAFANLPPAAVYRLTLQT
jgi:phosphatidylethanolamine/phosphatidyl-N-methylethanolamine N-methyltransferase